MGEQLLRFWLHMSSPCISLLRTFGGGTESVVPPQKPCWRGLVSGVKSLVLPFHNWNTRQLLRKDRGLLEGISTAGDAVTTGLLLTTALTKTCFWECECLLFALCRQKVSNAACLMLPNSVPQHVSTGFPPALPQACRATLWRSTMGGKRVALPRGPQHSTALCVGTCTEMPACDKSFGEQQHGAQLWFAKHNLMCEACERLICAEPLSAVCD